VTPLDGSVVTTDSVALLWQQSLPLVDRYWVERDTSMGFGTSIVDSLVTDTSQVVTQLQHDETYWWRVRAHNLYGWGEYSEARSFLVYLLAPSPPALLTPPNGTTGVSTSPALGWMESPGAESYTLQVSESSDFSTLVVDEQGIGSTSYMVNDLLNNITYFWRVNATNDLGTSNWSEIWSFTTSTTGVDDDDGNPSEFSLSQNYPNPFNPTTSIGFAISNGGFVSLKIYDLLGREVATIVNQRLLPGRYTSTWDATEVPSGVYLYRLSTSAFVETRKLVLLR
jgi:hypothetical protein